MSSEVYQIKTEYIPLTHVKKVFGLSESFMYQLHYERRLFHYKLGNRTFIKISELEELISKGKKGINDFNKQSKLKNI